MLYHFSLPQRLQVTLDGEGKSMLCCMITGQEQFICWRNHHDGRNSPTHRPERVIPALPP